MTIKGCFARFHLPPTPRAPVVAAVAFIVAGVGCSNVADFFGDGGSGGRGPVADAFVPPNCVPGLTECTDCIDNDHDGVADGFDPECISALDDDEGNFSTDISGDNIDPFWQDCFFDGENGGEHDCAYHTCCLIGGCEAGQQRASCTAQQACIDYCSPITPPGCDCYGCCTVCKNGQCYDVFLQPECSYEVIEDEVFCPRCTLNANCGNPCDPENCVLCLGQLPEDLPTGCQQPVCADGSEPCRGSADCQQSAGGPGQFCAVGCCINQPHTE